MHLSRAQGNFRALPRVSLAVHGIPQNWLDRIPLGLEVRRHFERLRMKLLNTN